MGTVNCPMFQWSSKARGPSSSSPGFLRGPSELQSEEILFGGQWWREQRLFSIWLENVSTLQCPILPSVKDFSSSEADPEIVWLPPDDTHQCTTGYSGHSYSGHLFYFNGLVCNYCYFMDSDDVVRFVHHQGTFMRLQKLSRKLIQKKFDLHLSKAVSGYFDSGYS